jgi:hypothetical protein
MIYRPLFACLLLLSCFCSYCQNDVLLVPAGVNLPPDSTTRSELLGSLRGWLGQKGAPVKENEYITADELATNAVFMDEIKGLDKRVKPNDTSYYKCYLTNVTAMDSVSFQVQLAYMGERNASPELRACCTVLAKQKEGKFYFSSPLQERTADWKTRQIGNCVFHYKAGINVKKAGEYQKRVAFYDKKLSSVPQVIDYYCCDNFLEASRLLGVEYRSDYNGLAYAGYSGFAVNHTVVISGEKWVDNFSDWDPHDTWHGRLSDIVHSATINRPVDEACAYLYGGSWRIYTPEKILGLFREYADAHPDANWLALYTDGTNFVAPPKILKISYAINALIVRELEKEKGFPAVLELLNCGRKENGDANYFAAVQRLTGVDEARYNEYVWKLVKAIN